MLHYAHDLDISAPRARVWAILSDLGGWHRWNPFVISAEGKMEVGHICQLRVKLGDELWKVQQRIVDVDPGRGFSWISWSWYRYLMTSGIRRMELQDGSGDTTHWRDRESIWGWLLPLMARTGHGEKVRVGMLAMAEALRTEAERTP